VKKRKKEKEKGLDGDIEEGTLVRKKRKMIPLEVAEVTDTPQKDVTDGGLISSRVKNTTHTGILFPPHTSLIPS